MDKKEIQNVSSSKSSSSKVPPSSKKKEDFIDRGNHLPQEYGDTKLTLLPRDPNWGYAYWEIGKQVWRNMEKSHGKEVLDQGRPTLRIYDVTDMEFNGKDANKVVDISIDFRACNWYFQVPEQDRHYLAEIGLLLKDGTFIPLARSNTIHIPRGKISDIVDEDWMIIKEEFKKLIHRAGLDKTGLSSQTIMRMIMQRIEGILLSQGPSSPRGASQFTKKKKS